LIRIILSLLTLCCTATFAQDLQLKLISSKAVPAAEDLRVDPFGNIFYLKGNEIVKVSSSSAEKNSYSDPRLGKINFFTLINPLQPLLYFTDYNTIQILDNRLNFSRSINLLDAGFIDPSLVTSTTQRQILIFDQVSDRLGIFAPESEKLLNYSPAINQLSSATTRPSLLLSSYNYHLLYLPHEGFLIFDALAAYKKKIPYRDSLADADFNSDLLVCLSQRGVLSLISVKTGQRQELICPQTDVKRVILHNRSLYLWTSEMLHQYKVE
jgi:hypothetical protein